MFGVAVNHFRKPDHPLSVLQSTKFALSLLKSCVEVTTIVLIDSSGRHDADLESFCQSIGVIYKHYDRVLSFAESYNFGVACLEEDWVVTMASDIYVRGDTFGRFKRFIEDNPTVPIGCLIPYLSSCVYPVQEASDNMLRHTCYSGIMTYNLNVFPKQVFQEIGGLSEKYSGNFNDIDTCIQLKKKNLRVVLVNIFVHHFGGMTLQHGTNVKGEADFVQFQSEYPDFTADSGLFQVRLDKLLEHSLLRLVSQASLTIKPRRLRPRLEAWVHSKLSRLQRISG